MARQRSSPMNKRTPPRSKLYSYTVHSGPKRARAVLKSVKEKPVYKQNTLTRKRAPRLTLGTDQTLLEPTAGYSDDESTPNEAESSEGEDWDDGNTLVSKFMDVDFDGPKNTDDAKINLVESLQVPFGQKNTSLKKDLMNVLVPTLDRIKQAHDEITDAKGPERRMEEGTQKFLQYTPEFTRKVEKSQADYEKAHAKCQETTIDLLKKLKQAYEKQHQSRVDFNTELRKKVNKMMEGLASHDEEMERLEATFMKRLKALAKIDSEKSLQNFLSLL